MLINMYAMLLGFSKNIVTHVSNPSKIVFFWRILHAPVDIFEKSESEQHMMYVSLTWGRGKLGN